MSKERMLLAVVGLGMLLPVSEVVEGASFRGLGDLEGGGFSSAATGISPDGSVVSGWGHTDDGWQKFEWTESGGMTAVGDPLPAPYWGTMFPDGSGFYYSDAVENDLGPGHVFTTAFNNTIQLPNAEDSWYDSDGGQVFSVEFEYTSWVRVDFPDEGSADGDDKWAMWEVASKINAAARTAYVGDIASVFYYPSSGALTMRLRSPRRGSRALDIYHHPPGSTTLDGSNWVVREGFGDGILDSTPDGSVQVGLSGWAVLWSDGVSRSMWEVLANDYGMDVLPDLGWWRMSATAVSDDGRTIVGYGINRRWEREAWMVIIPEPAAIALFCSGFALLLRPRRRRGN